LLSTARWKSIFLYLLSFWYLFDFLESHEDKNTFFNAIFKKDKNTKKIPKVSYLILSFVSF